MKIWPVHGMNEYPLNVVTFFLAHAENTNEEVEVRLGWVESKLGLAMTSISSLCKWPNI